MADVPRGVVRGCLYGVPIVCAAFWLPIIGWAFWPWSGTVWVIIYAALVVAWPVWELTRHFRKRRPRGPGDRA